MTISSLNGTLGGLFLGQNLGVVVQGRLAGCGFGFGAFQVHQIQRNIFPFVPLYAVKVDAVGLHFVFPDNVIAAILQVKLDVGGPSREHQQEECDYRLRHTDLQTTLTPGGFPR